MRTRATARFAPSIARHRGPWRQGRHSGRGGRSVVVVPLFTKAGVERRPDPAPLETDDARLVAAGTLLWVVAGVVLGVADLSGADVHGWWLAMCGWGTALGLVGVRFCRRRQAALARDRG